MIKSMTGFGKAGYDLPDKKVTVEVRSLNSRQLDLSIRVPLSYRDRETALRNIAAAVLKRGKVDFTIQFEGKAAENLPVINTGLVKHYVDQLNRTGREIGMEHYDPLELMKIAMRMPDALIADKQEPDDKEWDAVLSCFTEALDELDSYRNQEGAAIKHDLHARITSILEYLSEIRRFETERIENIRQRLQQNLQEYISTENIDRNRFEQEIIYYLEKIDITEEKVRLENHISYFRETLDGEGEQAGKKLGFISQEIGREINTIGSKANDFNIQKLVVQMKDELEKIKEQLLNIL